MTTNGKEIIVDGGTGTQVTIHKIPATVLSYLSSTNKNLPAEALAPYLAPQRAGDPLGLGIAPGERPPAPPDPDKYDVNVENASYSRSLLSEKKRRAVDESIKKDGFMTIKAVREIIGENTTKESMEIGGLDPEIMVLIDTRTDYKIFVAGDNVYTRNELYDHFPFHEFGVQPEAIFVQQEIGIFPQRKYAMEEGLEYLARDAGDESIEFVMLEDMVGQAARDNYVKKRAPLRIVKTKVYIGKERWEDFSLLQRMFRGVARVSAAQIAYNGGNAGSVNPMLSMLTGSSQLAGAPLRIADQATLDAEQQRREEEILRREEENKKREEENKKREEENRRREEENRRRETEVQKKIEADLVRVEAMLAMASKVNAANARSRASAATSTTPAAATSTTAATTATTAAAATDEADDSVPL